MKLAKKHSITPKAAPKSTPAPAVKPTGKPATTGALTRKRPTVPQVPSHAPKVAMAVTPVEIATRAYFIYLSAGRPKGREMEHWLEAEAQLTRC